MSSGPGATQTLSIHMHKIARDFTHTHTQRSQEDGTTVVDGDGGVVGLIMAVSTCSVAQHYN